MKKVIDSFYFKIAAALVVFYTLFGFIILPMFIEANFSQIVKERLSTKGTLQEISINPYTFEVEIKELELQDKKGKSLLSIGALAVNIEITKLLQKEFKINTLFIEKLESSVDIYKDGSFNFSYILKKLEENKKEEIKLEEPSEPFIFSLDNFLIQQGKFLFSDNRKSRMLELITKPFDVNLTNFSTAPNRVAKLYTNIDVIDSFVFDTNLSFSLTPMNSKGHIEISKIQLKKFYNYLQEDLNFVFGGEGGFKTSYEISLDNNLTTFSFKDMTVGLSSANYRDTNFNIELNGFNNQIASIDGKVDNNITYLVTDIKLKNRELQFTDLQKNKSKSFLFKNLDVAIDKVDSNVSQKSEVTTALLLPQSGSFNTKLSLVQKPFTIKGDVNLEKFTLIPYLEYIQDFAKVDLKSGLIVTSLNFDVNKKQQKVSGDLQLSNFDILVLENRKRLLQFNSFTIEGIDYKNSDVEIENVVLDNFQTTFKIDKDKTTTLDDVLIQNKSEKKSQKNNKQEPFNYYIKKVTVKNGKANFSDHSLPLEFDTYIHDLKTTIEDISSKNQLSEITFNGVVEKYGLATIKAKTTIADFKEKTDVAVNFENIDITSFTPYSGKFVGREIAGGKLWLDLDYSITDSQLSSTNRIKIKDIALGKDINSSDAMSLPLGLAIALLEDSQGMIDLKIPVTGDVSNPQFELGGVIWTAIGNIITNVVTAPFRFLGSLLGLDSDELGSIEFRNGSFEILPPEKEKLDKLTKLLNEKRSLTLVLNPIYHKEQDSTALVEKKFNELVKSKDKDKKITEIYIKEFGKKSYNEIIKKSKASENNETTKMNVIAEFEKQIKTTIHITDTQLEVLGKSRVEEIKNYLIKNSVALEKLHIKSEVVFSDLNNSNSVSLPLEVDFKR